jgi:DNA-binding MarR family transcriptional regulator
VAVAQASPDPIPLVLLPGFEYRLREWRHADTHERSGASPALTVDLRLFSSEPMRNIIAYMATGLSDTDVELFGSLFVLMQQLTFLADEHLRPLGLTSRQWLLLGVIDTAFPERPPTISEAAAVFGTSRQNVRQVVTQLERGGWLRLEPDPVDRRAIRLVPTDRLAVFDDPAVQADQAAVISSVFGGFTSDERRALLDMVTACTSRLSTQARGQHPSEGETS